MKAITIKKIHEEWIEVNDKGVHLNMDQVWVSNVPMNHMEEKAFKKYLKIISKLLPGSELIVQPKTLIPEL